MQIERRATGLPLIGDVPWGTHFCHFYRTRGDLVECLIPYFRAGLENNELCLWVTSEPLRAEQARAELSKHVPDLSRFREGLQVVDYENWYRRTGETNPNATVAAWREREAKALERGFSGMRVSGNTWLEQNEWKGFSGCESKVDDFFSGRRILALCSYSLDQCGSGDLTDLVRHHRFALVKEAGRWEVAHNATVLLGAVVSGGHEAVNHAVRHHNVQFYEERDFLAGKVADYVAEGLSAGERIVVIIDESSISPILEALRSRGVDPHRARETGRLLVRDARDTLSAFMEDGTPDRARFEATMGPLLEQEHSEQEHSEYPKVRVYGEMVKLLLRDGNAVSALELERLWNDFLTGKPVTLLCGYDLNGFRNPDLILDVSARHDSVHPSESLAEFDRGGRAGPLIGQLQHRTHLLQSETLARRQLESERSELLLSEQRARAQAELASARLRRLQAVTAALSEAATPADIADVIITEMANAASAEQAMLVVPTEDGTRLKLIAHAGLRPELASELAELPSHAPLPVAAAFRSGEALWFSSPRALRQAFPATPPEKVGSQAAACLPLVLGQKRLGAIVFGYPGARDFTPADRALLQDLARQASLALDRSSLLERAQQANRAKDEFLAMLSHELRNPLAALTSGLDLMKAQPGEERRAWVQEMLERQLRQLGRLVDDLLDVSRITRGKIKLRKESVELAKTVESAVNSVRDQLEDRGHRFVLVLPSRPVYLNADPARLQQILGNLLSNATKYSDEGSRIELAAEESNEEVVIRCQDTGWGMPPEMISKIFDPFTQINASPERTGGLGIGLTLVRRLVEMHDGSVSAQSEGLGKGSEFTVRLPRSQPKDRVETERIQPTNSTGRTTSPISVLVIDDNRDFTESVAMLLSRVGHTSLTAHDGESGIAVARRERPNLVLIDVGLPGIDGFEVARRLRREEGLKHSVLVAVSGYARKEKIDGSEFDRYLVKPLEPDRLWTLIDSVTVAKALPRTLSKT